MTVIVWMYTAIISVPTYEKTELKRQKGEQKLSFSARLLKVCKIMRDEIMKHMLWNNLNNICCGSMLLNNICFTINIIWWNIRFTKTQRKRINPEDVTITQLILMLQSGNEY